MIFRFIGIFFFLSLSVGKIYALDLPPQSELAKGVADINEAFQFNIKQQENQLYLKVKIKAYYYLYQDKISLSNQAYFAQNVKKKELTIKPQFITKAQTIKDDFFGEVAIYFDTLEASFDLSQFKHNNIDTLYLNYQGCWQGGVCYPPEQKKIIINNKDKEKISLSFKELTNYQTNQNYFSAILNEYSAFIIFVVFIFLGLLLAFTPCVLPTFPIIAGIIISSANHNFKKAFYLSLCFVISSAITYSIFGLVAALMGQNIQLLLQQQWINLISIAFLILFAGSMFGFYTIDLPKKWQNKLTQSINKQNQGSYIGSSLIGVLSTLIIGPCLAPPLAGILLFLANLGSVYLGMIALFALGLGMGLPLILLSSPLVKYLPQSGQWMNGIKKIIGCLLLLTCVYLLDRLVSDNLSVLFYGLVLAALAYSLINLSQNKLRKITKIILVATSLVIFSFSLAQIVGFFLGAKYATDPLAPIFAQQKTAQINQLNQNKQIVVSINQLNQALNEAKNNHKSVVAKLTASWCISCKTIEKQIFENEQVLEKIKDSQLIEIDLSKINNQSRNLLRSIGAIGPPAIYFYDIQGVLQPQMNLIGAAKLDQFLINLHKIQTSN